VGGGIKVVIFELKKDSESDNPFSLNKIDGRIEETKIKIIIP
jgi:hypothetical protein